LRKKKETGIINEEALKKKASIKTIAMMGQGYKLNNKSEKGNQINVLFDATVIANALYKNEGRTGIFFVAFNILSEMLQRNELHISLYCEKSSEDDLKEALKNYFSNNYDISIITDKLIVNTSIKNVKKVLSGIDVYFSPLFRIPSRIRQFEHISRFTVLYDAILLAFPEYFPLKQDWLLDMIDEITNEDYYFAISENTKKDFIKYVPQIDPEKINVAYLAASDNFHPCEDLRNGDTAILEKYHLPLDKKYIFSLCTIEPRKNLIFSVKCFISFIKKNQIDNLYFFLGGSQWDAFVKELELAVDHFKEYKDKVIKVGYIDDSDLSYFYSGSEFFVYPSLYEGFGLPVLEAMQCGVPVITSNTSSLPEVIGDAGMIINPRSEGEFIDAMEKLYFNSKFRNELSKKGIERAKSFNWANTVDIMVNELIKVVSKKNDEILAHNFSDKTTARKSKWSIILQIPNMIFNFSKMIFWKAQ